MSPFENITARHIYDLAPIGVCVLSAEIVPRVIYANSAFLDLINGVRFDANRGTVALTADKVENHPLEEVWPGEDIKKITTAIARGQGLPTVQVSVSDPDLDENRWAQLILNKTTFEDKAAWILWATDITNAKRAEEEAKTISEMKSSFLATMSHEIRTPMQTVYGLLELIAEMDPEQHILDMALTAQRSASGLLEILDDILDLAKVDAGKMELDQFEIPLRTLCYGVMEGMDVRVRDGGPALKTEISDDIPPVVTGDPKRLRQVLLNLLGNSIKFTEQGTVTLRVTRQGKHVKPARKRGFVLRFEIQDTGIGMSQDVADKLFQPFTQADSSTTRKFGGTGLGLSISQKLIDLMGGEIGVESIEGEGSTFWFEIPTAEASEEAVVDLPSLEGLVVLSVEDHPAGAKEILNSLQSMGARVESVGTYKEGLELIKARPFDVAVVDHGLPDGLGLDLLRDISDIRPFCGLILYTVRDDHGLQHAIKVLGATYLSKPASRLGLGEAVKAAAKQGISAIGEDDPGKLLIAEDTPAVRHVFEQQLRTIGVEADFVANGQEAWEAYKTGRYSILLTDLHMPDLDGYGLVQNIRQVDKKEGTHFPVVALTADVQLVQRQAYIAHGFDECLLKPVSLGQLRQLLMRWGVLREGAAVISSPHSKPGKTKAAIDQDSIVEIMGAFDSAAIEMLGLFVDLTNPLIKTIQTALKKGDMHRLREDAHSLKGAAYSACCNILGDYAGDLEQKAAANEDCAAQVKKIIDEFERVKVEIKRLNV